MTFMHDKTKSIINTLVYKEHWRYAIISTLSCLLAGLVSFFSHFEGLYVFYLILASATAAFYSYGPTLFTQTSMILSIK